MTQGPTVERIVAARRGRQHRRRLTLLTMSLVLIVLFVMSQMFGQTFYSLGEVVRVILGQNVPGASFTVAELRLPRASLAVLVGAAFGLAGVTFQTMLRNPLASPDIIGISSGASAAAVIGIVVLSWDQRAVSIAAVTAALGTALMIYVLAFKDRVVGTRLILIGIGIAAMLDSVIAYVIIGASAFDVQIAMRWLTGSLNGATWEQVLPVLAAVAIFGPLLLTQASNLSVLQQGDDSATALGVRVERTRLISILAAVALISFATAATGPIAFVAFLSGPIAARIVSSGSLLIPAALIGALLVVAADLLGQYAFGTRYPVGVITGALGAPYLIYLLIHINRAGGSL